MKINPKWNIWVEKNRHLMSQSASFKEQFVWDVLAKIDGLDADDVVPQYEFTNIAGGLEPGRQNSLYN